MFASITSAAVVGAAGYPVTVEVHVAKGLPGLTVVGLPDETVREARDRVRAALTSSGLQWPDQRVTVNLAPSELRKTGAGLDLAIAVGILVATGVIPEEAVAPLAFVGELGLDGSVRSVPGVAPMVSVIGARDVVVSPASAVEAGVAAVGRVRPVAALRELVLVLTGESSWIDHRLERRAPTPPPPPDLRDVLGQPYARAALELAAAGGHHTLFVGPPGSGKSMLAARLPGLLPPLDRAQALDVTMVHSAAGVGLPEGGLITTPPFRAPHHTASAPALTGGGSGAVWPGEASLAHCGVLFLDEVAEFSPKVLDGLRVPLEQGRVHVSRAQVHVEIPAAFLLVAAMNPCPCGGGDEPGECICSPSRARKYITRLSGPLLDRIDLRVSVARPRAADLIDGGHGESTAVVAARVAVARELALARQGCLNGRLERDDLDRYAPLSDAATERLRAVLDRRQLTGRGLHRVRRVARTIADVRLAGAVGVGSDDVGGGLGGPGRSIIGDDCITEADVALALELRSGFPQVQPAVAA